MGSERRYPLDPLRQLTGWSMRHITTIAPCGGPEYRTRLDQGVTAAIADRLAVAAGLHPHLVWPEMLDHAIEDHQRTCEAEGCAERFSPPDRAPHMRFCSPRCKRREKMRRYRARPHGAEANRRHSAAYREYLRTRRAA
jgi:hypothetical protein